MKKSPSLVFQPVGDEELTAFLKPYFGDKNLPEACEGSTMFVKVGRDVVAIVSFLVRGEEMIITQLYVLPEYRNFGIGTDILEALSQFEGVRFLRVIATPSTAAYYEDRGFEPDQGYVVMTKVLI